MKYILLINQKEAIRLGLSLQEAILLDILSTAATWAEPIQIAEQQYYWVARQKILLELPILNIKPDTLYRRLKVLQHKKLIVYRKKGKKDCFKLTELGKSYSNLRKKSDKSPSNFGKKSKKNLEKNPTNKTTKNNTITTSLLKAKSFYNFKKIVREKYSEKVVLNGSYVGYKPYVTFSLTTTGLLKNDYSHAILSVQTHEEDINKIWKFMYENPHLIGIPEPKEL